MRRAGLVLAAMMMCAGCDAAPPHVAAQRFGFGRPATAAEIRALDIGIMPDGTGLPAGSATAADGAPVYAAKCVACHGASGEGTPVAPRLVGRIPHDAFPFAQSLALQDTKTIGNYWPYATTIFDYVRRAMPQNHPGSLTDHEVYALTAWLLWKNDIVKADAVIDARTLPAVQMPARHRFVRDDREASTRVR